MAAASTDNTQYTRLHITPLDESLLNVVISSSVLPKARNISYHTIESFPEKRYGFIDLPNEDAEKLKKKLNGAVLRGSKMRIDKARPESIPDPTSETDPSKDKKGKKFKDKSKKRKREIDVIPGVALEDRKVKRGWTTTEQEMIKEKRQKSKKDKKDKRSKDDDKKDKTKERGRRKIKSKYTDEAECLFKTKLPESVPAKDNEDTTEHKKKKRKGGHEVVIHEFEKTVKYPSFLKSNTASTNSEAVSFEDGKGWVDSNGKVVEAVSTKKPKPTAPVKATKSNVPKPVAAEDEDDETSSSGTSSDEEADSSDQDSDSSEGSEENAAAGIPDEKVEAETSAPSSPYSPFKLGAGRKRSSGSFSSLTIKIPTTPAKVHPLEALYKRPKGEASTDQGIPKKPEPFSFFDNEDMEEDDTVAPPSQPSQPPMTPFTKQDFDYRVVRSAAPTPDTAHPTRSFNLWPRGDSLEEALDEEDEDEDEDEEEEEAEGQDDEDTVMGGAAEQGAATGSGGGSGSNTTEPPVSEFQKQFWENRGDLNRSWRKRRKTAAKEKRYRENKSRAQRAI